MSKDKFLTVFAVFDNDTQNQLKLFQKQLFENGIQGTQIMGIPFHISLGSFNPEKENFLKKQILNVSNKFKSFDIDLKEMGSFGNKVLFIQPTVNESLIKLHELFNDNYADGFPWHAHTTILCDEDANVIKARSLLEKEFKPIPARIIGLQMGEFFPARMIIEKKLK